MDPFPVPPFVDTSYTSCRLLARSRDLSSRDERREIGGEETDAIFWGKSTRALAISRFDRMKYRNPDRLGLLLTTLLFYHRFSSNFCN